MALIPINFIKNWFRRSYVDENNWDEIAEKSTQGFQRTNLNLKQLGLDIGGTNYDFNNEGLKTQTTSVVDRLDEIESYQASNIVGSINNIAVSLTSGRFKIVGSDGNVFSETNIGAINIPSTTIGRWESFSLTEDRFYFDDSASGVSDIVGEEFGTTAGTAWSEARSFFIYAVNSDNTDEGVEIAISPSPTLKLTPGTTNIGYHGVPMSSPSDVGMFFLTSENISATHNNKPCLLIGSFRMTKNSSDDWAVATLLNSDGIGFFQDGKSFNMPTGHYGSITGGYLFDNGGTAPVFSTQSYSYYIDYKTGLIYCYASLSGDGGTDGAGSVDTRIVAPYKNLITSSSFVGQAYASNGGGTVSYIATVTITGSQNYFTLAVPSVSGTALQNVTTGLQNSFWTNGASRSINYFFALFKGL